MMEMATFSGQMPDAGRIQDSGCKIQDPGCRMLDTGFKIQDSRSRIQDTRSRNQVSEGRIGQYSQWLSSQRPSFNTACYAAIE
jgi:hypothetical protein